MNAWLLRLSRLPESDCFLLGLNGLTLLACCGLLLAAKLDDWLGYHHPDRTAADRLGRVIDATREAWRSDRPGR